MRLAVRKCAQTCNHAVANHMKTAIQTEGNPSEEWLSGALKPVSLRGDWADRFDNNGVCPFTGSPVKIISKIQ